MPELILDYAKKPALLRRRVVRRAIWIIALSVAAFYGARFGREVFYRFKLQASVVAMQKQAATWSAPPTMVMASDFPEDLAAFATPPYAVFDWNSVYLNYGNRRPDRHLGAILQAPPGLPPSRLVRGNMFLIYSHALRTKAGTSRIAIVNAEYWPAFTTPQHMKVSAWPHLVESYWPRSTRPGVTSTSTVIPLRATDRVRFFAGQSDPADPSRFTFRYQINDQTFEMEGVLDDSGSIRLSAIQAS